MGVKYALAPEVKKIAEELIPKYHTDLLATRVEYAFLDKTATKNGKEVWGQMKKVSGLPAFLAAPVPPAEAGAGVSDDGEVGLPENEPFFVLLIAKPVWEILDTRARLAMVDHYLCKAGTEEQEDGSLKLIIVAADIEEHTEIVERHGMWQPSVSEFISRAKRQTPSAEIEELNKTIEEE